MNHASFPAAAYAGAVSKAEQELAALNKRKSLIAWSRLLVACALLVFIYLDFGNWTYRFWIVSTALLAVFIRLVVIAVNNKTQIRNVQTLIQLHKNEIQIADGDFLGLANGSGFTKAGHPYTNDLDIFGPASLYQYVNRCQSDQGASTLANWLSAPADAAAIAARQEAVRELGPLLEWRQQLQAYGVQDPIRHSTEEKISAWLKGTDEFSHDITFKIVRYAWPVIGIGMLLLFLFDKVTVTFFSGFYIAALGFSGYLQKRIMKTQQSLDKIVPVLSTLADSARWIENKQFSSGQLESIRQRFVQPASASLAIGRLKKILDQFEFNLNFLFLLLVNPFLLWNLQMIFSLERWRRQHRNSIEPWFSALGETEALCSIAAIHFNHPHWTFPIIDGEQHGLLEATGLGHPLIAETTSVLNDFSTEGNGQIALITGSNMAGKSTFLRSIGVNMVLAMAGSPVLANRFKASVMKVSSSMRVADNLHESTSTFYAELKRLKAIIEQVKQHEPVLVLLDEILRGTNSLDRHTGSAALIRLLIRENAVALLATHDVELAEMAKDYSDHIHNYHFDAQIDGEELYFDYRLKAGVCQSINASLLMRKIGIDV